jgi:uncharacterized membrane protein
MTTTASNREGSAGGPGQTVVQRMPPAPRMARFLGWFSLGLGVPQTIMPGAVNRFLGIRDDRSARMWQRIVGVRELAAAAGILVIGWPRPVAWLWSRVAGDAMDLALLGAAFDSKNESTPRLTGAIGAVTAITVADVVTAERMTRMPEQQTAEEEHAKQVKAAITVRQPPEEVYRFWHDFQNLPRFMAHLESVEPAGDGRSHWKASAPAGRTIEWDAEVVEDRPNEVISWRSVKGAVDNSGSVRFARAPGERGTEIRLDMRYAMPGGAVASRVAKLFGEEPAQQVQDDLRRFKQVLETGTVVRSEGTPEGINARRLLRQRPAQPPPASVRAASVNVFEGRPS